MMGDGGWHIYPAAAGESAPEAKFDVLQIRPEGFVERPHLAKKIAAEQGCGHRGEADGARQIPPRAVRPTGAATAGAGAARNLIEGSVDGTRSAGPKNFPGGEPRVLPR